MVWNFPDVSLEEMVKLTKGFIDILILTSGYQSSGYLAHWDAHNIKKAFQWASFFENVLGQMTSSDVYHESVKELDAALSEMTSNPSFPQGLVNLSCDTLNKARSFVLAHLFHTLPLRDSHLRGFLIAIIEMDLDNYSGSGDDVLSVYLNMLVMQDIPCNLVSQRRGLVKDLNVSQEDIITSDTRTRKCIDNDLTKLTLQELFKRQSSVSFISTLCKGLDLLSGAIRSSSSADSDSKISEEQLKHEKAQASVGKNQLADFVTWNWWKSLNLSYFLDKRTVRLVSGGSMIFSAPKVYWVQVFERLNASEKCNEDGNLHETIELMLLGCVTSKWNRLIEYFMSVSYESSPISKLYHEVCSLLSARSLSSHLKEESTDSKCVPGN